MAEEKQYDVFISYRRDKGLQIARTLQQGLKEFGLRVFFDMEELTDGKFNEKLYDAIEQSKNVIFLMTEGALNRCVNDGDWVRNELEHVTVRGVNLIPVAPSGTPIVFPEGLPEALAGMKNLEVSELNLEKLFNESLAKIAKRLQGVVLRSEEDRQRAEETFLSMARRYKDNDGFIDEYERAELEKAAQMLGLSPARMIMLLEQVEQSYDQDADPRFDVFLSYRRGKGEANAKQLYDRLVADGYTVSFQHEAPKSGRFNEELLRRVAECRNYVVILNEGCFARTLEKVRRENDWMRLELATALYNRKNVIPVYVDGFEMPKALPPDIDAVRGIAPLVLERDFNSFYEGLKSSFGRRAAKQSGKEGTSLAEEVVSVDADEADGMGGFDDLFGDDAAFWREEALGIYQSISRLIPYAELQALDGAWQIAEESLNEGDHQTATRKYIEVIERVSRVRSCSLPFVTQLIGDGIDPKQRDWFVRALAAAQKGEAGYEYGVGVLYSSGIGVEKDVSAAFRWFERAAQKKEVKALSAVGVAYAMGMGVEVDYAQAHRYLEEAYRSGDSTAGERLGYLYENGFGVSVNLDRAVDLYREAAKQGCSAAMVALGSMYETGLGQSVDLETAAVWYRSAVANDSAVAQRKMGEFLFLGKGVEKNYEEALRLVRLAANQGDADAVALLGRAYEEAWGVEANRTKAAELYRKAVGMGSALAKSSLANLEAEAQYRNGLKCLGDQRVGGIDFVQAVSWFSKAAGEGHVRAMEWLGYLAERGLGCARDTIAAKSYYQQAADKGYAPAQVGLGKLYFFGFDGVERDYVKAEELFRKAAGGWRVDSDESRWKSLYAFYFLGRIYAEGLGVKRNVMLGQRCFLLGAHNGNTACCRSLGLDYAYGNNGFPVSTNDAARWYQASLDLEKSGKVSPLDDVGLRTLAYHYRYGESIEVDLGKAFELYKRSAELGNVSSLATLGRFYRDGQCPGAADLAMARECLVGAAKRGDDTAQNTLGWSYYKGLLGFTRDETLAFEWEMKSAQKGNDWAMETLYRMYRDGAGVERNEAEAKKWLEASIHAGRTLGRGNPLAWAFLGEHYEKGTLGFNLDCELAIECYRKSVEKKCPVGMYRLAECYLNGVGVAKDVKEAQRLLSGIRKDDDLFYDEKALRLRASILLQKSEHEEDSATMVKLRTEAAELTQKANELKASRS